MTDPEYTGDGWVPFGFHVVDGPCPPVKFGTELDEGGLPVKERLDHERFPDWLRGLKGEALREAADQIDVAYQLKGAKKDLDNLSYQEGYLDGLDAAEQIVRARVPS